jgi:hypothetical protein
VQCIHPAPNREQCLPLVNTMVRNQIIFLRIWWVLAHKKELCSIEIAIFSLIHYYYVVCLMRLSIAKTLL